MTERRLFNRKAERSALYHVEGGRCARCGELLEPGWHGDHVIPHSRGGETDVTNGQALCPRCSLKKGATMPITPRAWQQRFIAKYHACPEPNFLLVACPGAGKTLAALLVARDLLRDGVIDRILVVVPSGPLRMQWHRAALQLGLLLDGSTMNNSFGEMATIDGQRTQGWIVTYASLALDAMGHKILNSRRRTFVILDEVHHLSVDNSWGQGAVHALQPAVRRLSTSGTPFRGDRGEIPFIEYKDGWARYRDDDDGTPYPRGFDYSYGAALAEHKPPERIAPVRPVVFEMFDGDVTWLEGDEGEEKQARISAPDLDKQTRRKTKKHALNPAGVWLRDTLANADRRLLMVREEGDTPAKGIIFCYDTEHAHEVAGALASIIGHAQVQVAVSKETSGEDTTEEARRIIEQFGAGSARWLVTVLMVSEGVDIPVLRVAVYATVVRSELFFRQALGRVERRVDYLPAETDQTAYVFVPKDPEMVQLADNVLDEVTTALLREEEDITREEREAAREWQLRLDSFVSSTAEAGGILVPGEGRADHELVNLIAGESREPVSAVARMLTACEKLGISLTGSVVEQQPGAAQAAHERSYVDRIKGRKGQLESGFRQLAGAYQRKNGGDFGDIIKRLKWEVYRDAGIQNYARADLPQIDAAIQIVRKRWGER